MGEEETTANRRFRPDWIYVCIIGEKGQEQAGSSKLVPRIKLLRMRATDNQSDGERDRDGARERDG